MVHQSRLTPPTQVLPPLGRLFDYKAVTVRLALDNVRLLYFPPQISQKLGKIPLEVLGPSHLSLPKRNIRHVIHDSSAPDSGYASAEDVGDDCEIVSYKEDEDEDEEGLTSSSEESSSETEALRFDPMERNFSIKWVTGFVSRFDDWATAGDIPESEIEFRNQLFEEAVSLLAAFNGSEEEDEDVALTRKFTFPLLSPPTASNTIDIDLNDAPLSKEDHTSVGLQSWGSSILLAKRICSNPSFFFPALSFPPNALGRVNTDGPIRILELGAGTGMLSVVAGKIFQSLRTSTNDLSPFILATDYHPDVLRNLKKNVETNFPFPTSTTSSITVSSLDWENPCYDGTLLGEPFHIIVAADVIYHPLHATWIKGCVERLLDPDGTFWLMIPIRTTGRHEGIDQTVDALFPLVEGEGGINGKCRLATLLREDIERKGSIGRADEGGYRLFKVGWVGEHFSTF